MGLVDRPLFTQAWVDRYSPIVERAMVATIEVYGDVVKTYNATTDTYDETHVVVYGALVPDAASTGKARVQPLRSAYREENRGNTTSVQTYLFSIPIAYKAIPLKIGQQVRVLSATLNPALLNYKFVVSEIGDSSNPIERTFYATFNEEDLIT